mmetsp:Transcript_62676/g.111743  ORF Transcript_62676/g.111743 Transcript_62676/m.111743 type:complete len:112 (-) Transcript_62676:1103-1438(-)
MIVPSSPHQEFCHGSGTISALPSLLLNVVCQQLNCELCGLKDGDFQPTEQALSIVCSTHPLVHQQLFTEWFCHFGGHLLFTDRPKRISARAGTSEAHLTVIVRAMKYPQQN